MNPTLILLIAIVAYVVFAERDMLYKLVMAAYVRLTNWKH